MARKTGAPIEETSRHSFCNIDQRFTDPLQGLREQQIRDTEAWQSSLNMSGSNFQTFGVYGHGFK